MSSLVTREQIESLPTNSRNYLDFALLTPMNGLLRGVGRNCRARAGVARAGVVGDRSQQRRTTTATASRRRRPALATGGGSSHRCPTALSRASATETDPTRGVGEDTWDLERSAADPL